MRRWLVALFASLALLGCGVSFEDAARGTLNTAGQALVVVDEEVARAYTEAAREALEASTSLPEYEAAMSPWDSLVDSLGVVQTVLLSAEALLDAGDAYLERDFLRVLAELVEGFVDVARTMQTLGVDVPQQLLDFVDMAENLLGGR